MPLDPGGAGLSARLQQFVPAFLGSGMLSGDQIDQRRDAIVALALVDGRVMRPKFKDVHAAKGRLQHRFGVKVLRRRGPARTVGDLLGPVALQQ